MDTLTRPTSESRSGTAAREAGLLALRAAVGALLVGHGLNKLLGWFNGAGLTASTRFFESVGYTPARPLVILTGVTEIVAGLMLVVGLLLPLAAAAIVGDMLNAAMVKSPRGFWISNNGYELEAVLIAVALVLAIAGAGAYSFDRNRRGTHGLAGFLIAAVVGFGAGAILLAIRD